MKFSFGNALELTFIYFKKVFMHFTFFSMIIITLALISNSFHPYAGLLFQFAVWPLLLAGYYLYLMEETRRPNTPFGIFFRGTDYFISIVLINAVKLIFSSLFLLPYTAEYSGLLQEFMETRNTFLQSDIIASLSSIEFIAGIIASFLLFYLTSLSVPYAIFHKNTPLKAISKSILTNLKHIKYGLLYYLILVILSGIGFLFFGVGLFLTAGIYFCGIFALYVILHVDKNKTIIEDTASPEIRIE